MQCTFCCKQFFCLFPSKKHEYGEVHSNTVINKKKGYIDVRPGAHMSWWLYETTAPVSEPTDRPLAIWLQGGPGAASSGYGNFEEIGPLDYSLKERKHTWVQHMNVLLFIDSPVGAGFSYVDNLELLTKSDDLVVHDLYEFVRKFLIENERYRGVPLHIFGESYSGKIVMLLAQMLQKAIDNESIVCNLKSVTSIDGWIAPLDTMYSWPKYLRQLGFVGQAGYDQIENVLMTINSHMRSTVPTANKSVMDSRGALHNVLESSTGNVDMYNVMTEKGNVKRKAIN